MQGQLVPAPAFGSSAAPPLFPLSPGAAHRERRRARQRRDDAADGLRTDAVDHGAAYRALRRRHAALRPPRPREPRLIAEPAAGSRLRQLWPPVGPESKKRLQTLARVCRRSAFLLSSAVAPLRYRGLPSGGAPRRRGCLRFGCSERPLPGGIASGLYCSGAFVAKPRAKGLRRASVRRRGAAASGPAAARPVAAPARSRCRRPARRR